MSLNINDPVLKVSFFKSERGQEPVRDWLLGLNKKDRKAIGQDIKTAQFGWPVGMPLIRKFEKDIWEVRSRIENGIARTFFTVNDNNMVLIHGFVKKSISTPKNELKIVKDRLKKLNRGW